MKLPAPAPRPLEFSFFEKMRATTAMTAVSAALSLAAAPVMAAPVFNNKVGDVTVVNGTTGVGDVTVNQADPKVVLNWNSYDVATPETVTYNQPSASAVALNRIGGANPSDIKGRIQANGKIVLVNPNGFVFGPDSSVNVASLIASTADIQDSDFFNDTYKFSQSGAADAEIKLQKNGERQASITAAEAGLVALVAPRVTNDGIITANKGAIAIGAGETATLDFNGDGLVSFAVGGKSAGNNALHIKEDGVVQADGGKVWLTANAASDVVDQAINVAGLVQAQTLTSARGEILLNAKTGNARVTGTLDASGNAENEKGGKINIKGEDVRIEEGATLRTDGPDDGGTITIRGTTSVELADEGEEEGSVLISANGGSEDGEGGEITITSPEGDVKFWGGATISSTGHDGGQLEISGENVILAGNIDLEAFGGDAGTFTLDPAIVHINDGSPNGLVNNISETFIEGLSQAGTDVAILATDEIQMHDLSDDELTGGAGDIELRATGATGWVHFGSTQDQIRTTSGDIRIYAGSGGIDIGSLHTGEDYSALVKDQPTGDFQAGSVELTTTNGGSVALRDIAATGTKKDTTVTIVSDGDVQARDIEISILDLPDPGSADKAEIIVQAVGNISVEDDVDAHSHDNQGATRITSARIHLKAGGDLAVGGDVKADSFGGVRGEQGDPSGSSAEVVLEGGTIDVGDVTASARNGETTDATVKILSTGTVAVGDVLAEALTHGYRDGKPPVAGDADAFVQIAADGTATNDDSGITYKSGDPIATADDTFLQSRLSDIDTSATAVSEIVIVDKGGDDTGGGGDDTGGGGDDTGGGGGDDTGGGGGDDTGGGGDDTGGGGDDTGGGGDDTGSGGDDGGDPTLSPLALNELDEQRDSGFDRGLYSFFGETLGNPYYYGNTDVNLTLLSGGKPVSLNVSSPEALGNLAPAAGGSAEDLANLSPAAGGDPCGNNYLDAGFSNQFNSQLCTKEQF